MTKAHIYSLISLCDMPVKTVNLRTNDAPWMTNEIRSIIKQRGEIHNKAKSKRSNLKEDWDNFRTSRNDGISKVRKRKLEYFDELTEKVSNPDRFGKQGFGGNESIPYLRKKGIGSKEKKPLCQHETIIYANKEKANVFNDVLSGKPLWRMTATHCRRSHISIAKEMK